MSRRVRRVLIVWSAIWAVLWIMMPIGQAFERWTCEDDPHANDDEVVTCEEIMEESVLDVVVWTAGYFGLIWLVGAGAILGSGMLIARIRG